jgi:formate/nitrite transporter FocA (FNT family)
MPAAKSKIKEWLLRYGPAEIVSLIGTLLAAWLIFHTTGNRFETSVAGTLGGNVGYFGTILLQDVIRTRKKLNVAGRTYTGNIFGKNIRALFIEFGLAEVLDTLLIRPFLLYKMPLWIGDLTWGLIIAKFAADVTFYLPAILFYEWSKKRFRKF